MRNLIVVPTLHDITEAHPVYATQSVMPGWERLQEVKNFMWQSIDQEIIRRSADIPHWKVFAEGVLSLTPRPPQIFLYQEARKQVEESMNVESRQNAFMSSLWLAGATFIPTDDPVAYQKTFEAWDAYKQLGEQMEPGDLDAPVDNQTQEKAEELIAKITTLGEERDRHAGHIVDTHLQEDESGILIFGALHNIVRFLPSDITVSFISRETKEFWNLLQDPQTDSLYDATNLFLEKQRKRKEQS